jgi:hypothetical protein
MNPNFPDGLLDRKFFSATDAETAPSIPRFAPTQGIKSKKNVSGLTPKDSLISAEAIKRVVGQIRETQEATRELSAGIDPRFERFPIGGLQS